MSKKNLLLFIVFSSCFVGTILAQQGKVDPTFNTFDDGFLGDGFDATVRTLTLQPDGKLLVGGDFLNFNGVTTSHLCRLLTDGTKDNTFATGTGFDGNIYSSILQPDGKIVVCGNFTQYNGTSAGGIIRLTSNGDPDASFVTAGITTNTIYDMALQADGSLFLVGSFTKFNGVVHNRIVKILTDGTVDTTFVTGTGALGLVEKVALQSDGKVIITGDFVSYKSVTVYRIARLNTDGSLDATFASGTGFDNNVSAIAIQSDGKIILGGSFTVYNGNATNRIIRLNNDGTPDPTFISGSGFNSGAVAAIALNPAGEILLSGSFADNYNGTNVNRIQLLNTDGTIAANFNIGNGPATATVYALENDTDGSWYVGGSFSVFDDQNQGKLAKIDAQGNLDISYLTSGVGLNNSVSKIIALADKSMIAFGNFTQFNGINVPRIAKLNEDGTIISGFNTAGSGANNSLRNAALQADGKIIIVGNFTTYNGTAANRIARLMPDGNLDSSFLSGTACNGHVYSVSIQSDGKIIIAGNFSEYNDVPAEKIVRLLPDGTLDTSFNTGFGAEDGIVESVVIQPDGKILLGGHFTIFNGVSANSIIRLNTNGSVDSGLSSGTGFDKTVYKLALQADGKILAGGTFLNYNGNPKKRIARLHPDGSIDTGFLIGTGFSNGTVRDIVLQPNGSVLIGGTFSDSYNGTAVKRMTRLKTDGTIDGNFSVNLNGTLNTIAITTDEKVLLGGTFNSVSGVTKHRIARIILCVDATKRAAGNWSNGVPTAGKEVVFEDNFTASTTIHACNCTIATGIQVNITAGNALVLRYQYEGNGLLVLENTAALLQLESQIVNSGKIQLKRNTTPILKTDYTYWSSPVQNQKLLDVSPLTLSDKFFSYDALAGDWKTELPTNLMTVAKGYIIRGPQNFSTATAAVYQAVFEGIPNNGNYAFPVKADEYNLIGNPYPSAIDATQFMKKNSAIIYGALYFWTHNTPINGGSYTANDYATFNITGGTGTSTGAAPSSPMGVIPKGYIAAGQSFFVGTETGISDSQFVFTNALRVADNNDQFFKQTHTQKTATTHKNRIWLNLTNTEGAFKQLLVGYVTGATNDWDNLYDGPSFDGQKFVDFYSINNGNKLAIQGRAIPFEITDEVPLGYRSAVVGTFEISIDAIEGELEDREIWLEDKKTGITHDLSKGSYIFSAIEGVENDRFVLKYFHKSLDTDDNKIANKAVLVAVKNKSIIVTSTAAALRQIQIFDLLGCLIYTKSNLNTQQWKVPDFSACKQTLIVKTTLENGPISSTKIVF